jgi:release factor glutamine methyltransferase
MMGLVDKPRIGCLALLKEADERIDRLDAEIILAHLLGISRPELYIYEKGIDGSILNRFRGFIEQRAAGRPVQYIIGNAEFMGLKFIVTPDVFIPRPETELLVEAAIGLIETVNCLPAYLGLHWQASKPHTVHLLDLGTGSGNIAISLTKAITDCKIIASDVSKEALIIAKENAVLNGEDGKIEFVLSDLFENLGDFKFDTIVSNPPYVASRHFGGLSKEVSLEPRLALHGGPNGLDFYRRIIKEAGRFLRDDGSLIFEVGFGQAGYVRSLLEDCHFNNIRIIYDYNHIPRVMSAKWIN